MEAHPHDIDRAIPDRLEPQVIRELSVLDGVAAWVAIAEEWAMIVGAIALCHVFWSPPLYVVLVMFIGARQHALAILAHDAVHYRLLPQRALNDLIGNMFLMWPTFASVEGFRKFHGTHHKHLSGPQDGNRQLWKTHNQEGHLTPEWVYPKTFAGLAFTLVRRAFFFTGVRWMLRGVIGGFLFRPSNAVFLLRIALYAAAALCLTKLNLWYEFALYWIVPFCTWHILIQYARLICEHSAVMSDSPEYQLTRTTCPTLLESLFILPRNIGYHIEHHWYPSVPFYRLPELHRHLMSQPNFAKHANVSRSVLQSLRQCIRSQHA